MKTHIPNTYDLVIESESQDRRRTVIETLIYAAFILSAVVSIAASAAQAIAVPNHIAHKQIVCQDGRPC